MDHRNRVFLCLNNQHRLLLLTNLQICSNMCSRTKPNSFRRNFQMKNHRKPMDCIGPHPRPPACVRYEPPQCTFRFLPPPPCHRFNPPACPHIFEQLMCPGSIQASHTARRKPKKIPRLEVCMPKPPSSRVSESLPRQPKSGDLSSSPSRDSKRKSRKPQKPLSPTLSEHSYVLGTEFEVPTLRSSISPRNSGTEFDPQPQELPESTSSHRPLAIVPSYQSHRSERPPESSHHSLYRPSSARAATSSSHFKQEVSESASAHRPLVTASSRVSHRSERPPESSHHSLYRSSSARGATSSSHFKQEQPLVYESASAHRPLVTASSRVSHRSERPPESSHHSLYRPSSTRGATSSSHFKQEEPLVYESTLAHRSLPIASSHVSNRSERPPQSSQRSLCRSGSARRQSQKYPVASESTVRRSLPIVASQQSYRSERPPESSHRSIYRPSSARGATSSSHFKQEQPLVSESTSAHRPVVMAPSHLSHRSERPPGSSHRSLYRPSSARGTNLSSNFDSPCRCKDCRQSQQHPVASESTVHRFIPVAGSHRSYRSEKPPESSHHLSIYENPLRAYPSGEVQTIETSNDSSESRYRSGSIDKSTSIEKIVNTVRYSLEEEKDQLVSNSFAERGALNTKYSSQVQKPSRNGRSRLCFDQSRTTNLSKQPSRQVPDYSVKSFPNTQQWFPDDNVVGADQIQSNSSFCPIDEEIMAIPTVVDKEISATPVKSRSCILKLRGTGSHKVY